MCIRFFARENRIHRPKTWIHVSGSIALGPGPSLALVLAVELAPGPVVHGSSVRSELLRSCDIPAGRSVSGG